MNYVNWWLFGLSSATGFVLTSALTVHPVKRRARQATSAEPDPPTTKILADPPTTKIPVDAPTTRMPVANESATTKIPVGQEFPTTKIRVATESATTKIPVSPLAPYGPGSANAGPDGGGPPGWLVKGRMDTKLYYTPDDPPYDAGVAQVWFIDEESAERARFTRWRQRSKD
jgi:uncharacterized membrane protein ArfC